MVTAAAPDSITVRMYQVGFGDCFLVTFHYGQPLEDGRAERHMLVDFGSTHLTDGRALSDVASLIKQHCRGILDVVVVSHRHRDHLSAFGNDDVATTLRQMPPRLLLRPWTDDPHDNRTEDENRRHVAALRVAEQFAVDLDDRITTHPGPSVAGLPQLAELSAGNAKAVEFLTAWDELPATEAQYPSYGQPVEFDHYVPGVTCDVLGPPRIDQWPEVRRQRYDDANEFWLGLPELPSLVADPATERTPPCGSGVAGPLGIGPARWLVDQLAEHGQQRLLDLVDGVDQALNNTSLILLFTARGAGLRRLLFAGDAQIENWEYVLGHAADSADMCAALADIDLYKVGHHGSRNATPKTLVNLWAPQRCSSMVALMSTKADVHGRDGPNPVPKPALIEGFQQRGITLFRTDEAGPDEKVIVVRAAVDGERAPFVKINDAQDV